MNKTKKNKIVITLTIIWIIFLIYIIINGLMNGAIQESEVSDKTNTTEESEVSDKANTTEESKKSENTYNPTFPDSIDGIDITFKDTVRNDKTGNWRLALIAYTFDSDKDLEKFIKKYHTAFFDTEDEIHIIVNFSTNTVISIRDYGVMLDYSITEYEAGEEHDAAKLAGGSYLGGNQIQID